MNAKLAITAVLSLVVTGGILTCLTGNALYAALIVWLVVLRIMSIAAMRKW